MPKLPRQNLEFKATVDSLADLRQQLVALKAEYSRTMCQVDTYFNVPKGRLKLREIEDDKATLVYYERTDAATSRYSNYHLCDIAEPATFKGVMSSALGVKVIVEKKRELWMYGNTRIHLDKVTDLREFIELETVIRDQSEAKAQVEHQLVKDALQIASADVIRVSYSDLLLRRTS